MFNQRSFLFLLTILPTLVVLASPATARPGEFEIRPITPRDHPQTQASAPLSASAVGDTVYFGGTVWNPDSLRWEAIPGGTWTFDSGTGSHFDHGHPDVDPSKDPSRHAFMEGWVGRDFTRVDPNSTAMFSRRSTFDFSGTACVGAPAGLGGTHSMWAGLTEAEAAGLGWAGGQGYGNDWDIVLEHDFTYSGTGTVAISFGYTHNLEAGYDFATLVAEYPGGVEETLQSFTGSGSGTFNLNWTPLQSGSFMLRLRVESDAAYSDEDGFYGTTCGAFAFDDISLGGGSISYSSDFESDDGGWLMVIETPPALGEWTDIRSLGDIDSLNATCPGMSDSVLVFFNDSSTIHEDGKLNYAISPWIDLESTGVEYYPNRFIEFDHADEVVDGQYIDLMVQTYEQNDQGTGEISDWTRFSSVNWPNCADRQQNFAGELPLGAKRIRIAIGVLRFCGENCRHPTEILPWVDNVRVGVARTLIFGRESEQPGDSFPTDGTLGLSSPARCDAQDNRDGSRGDTLQVLSFLPGTADLEVEVVFSVFPGPGINTTSLNDWLSSHPVAGTFESKTWYSARLDTAETGGVVAPEAWMTAYHESDPNFQATDTALDPGDPGGHLLNDIFPDDLFTPGTRLCLYYRARSPQTGNDWVAWPDPFEGDFLEMEVLPSSMTAGGNHNPILFVSDVEFVDSKRVIEGALARVVPGTSSNAEGTPWDQLDVFSSVDFGLDATAVQLEGYDTIVFNSPWEAPTETGAQALHFWIQSGPGVRNLYMSGGDLAESMARGSWNRLLLNGPMGVDFPGIIAGISTCYELLPVPGAPVGNIPTRAAVQRTRGGRVTPGSFSVDRVVPYSGPGAVGAPLVDEHFYSGFFDEPASIVNQDALFRTVFDAVSLHARYEGPDCDLVDRRDAVDQRLREVFMYFGLSTVGLSDRELNPRPYRLGISRPNPFSASTVVSFNLAVKEAVTLRIFDLQGRLVRTLVDAVAEAGNYSVRWDGRDEKGAAVSAGVFFYKLATPNYEQSRRVVVIR